ncbi:MAG: hypothetical protein J7J91_07710 [Deltaproteobacteria bacterium]|nr:hypothetical protein [Deltaproteobacteria bacterium]
MDKELERKFEEWIKEIEKIKAGELKAKEDREIDKLLLKYRLAIENG